MIADVVERTGVDPAARSRSATRSAAPAPASSALAHELRRRGGRYGVASLCAGVGQGVATVIERV